MPDKLNFGIIGCGRISGKHVEGIINNQEEARLVAVSDLVPKKMDKAVSFYRDYLKDNDLEISDEKLEELRTNQISKYENHQDLLGEEDIDVLTIATESGYHPDLTIEGLKAGKHVIVEKPMALSINDAEEMIKAAKKEGQKLSVCSQNRFNPTVQKLRQAKEAGRFGKLIHGVASIRWNRNEEYYNMDDWHGTLDLDGGILMNQGLHNIDMLRWMMGDVERVTAETDNFLRDIETEDAGMAVVRFKNGSIGLIEGSVCIYPENLEETFNVFGEKGTVRLAGVAMNEIIDWNFADGGENEEEEMKKANYETDTVYGYGHNLLFEDVIDAIKEDRKPLVDGREGKKAVELTLGIYKSARNNKPVEFPLDNYSTTTDVET